MPGTCHKDCVGGCGGCKPILVFSFGQAEQFSSSTVPQETVRTYLKLIPKPTINQETDNMEVRDSRKEGSLAGKPLRINILTGNGKENIQKLLRKTVPGNLTALCQPGTLSGNMNTTQINCSEVCGNTAIGGTVVVTGLVG